jgi:hypothetical protein
VGGQRGQGLIEHGDVVRRGVRSSVTRTQQTPQGPRRRRLPDGPGTPATGENQTCVSLSWRRFPSPRSARSWIVASKSICSNPVRSGAAPAAQNPPRRRHTGHRTTHPGTVTEHLDVRDTVRAISNRHRHIGEHPARRMHPRTGIRIRQRGRHPGRKPGVPRQLTQHPTPACDTTPTPSAPTFTRRKPLLRFTREVPSRERIRTLDKSQFPLRGRQALRPISGPCHTNPRETPGLRSRR